MGRLRWEQAVLHCIAGRPELLPVFHDVFGVAESVREYNPDLFIVLNVGRVLAKSLGLPRAQWPPLPHGVIPVWGAWWEIHHLHERPSLSMTVPYGALDKRILVDLYEGDLRIHGDAIFRRLEAHNARVEARNQRDTANQIEALTHDTRSLFARAAWGQSVFGPGNHASTGMVLPGVKN